MMNTFFVSNQPDALLRFVPMSTDFPYLLPSLITEKIERTPFLLLSSEERELLTDEYNTIMHHYGLVNHPVKPTATHREELTEKFFRLLHDSFSTCREVTFYADQLCITPRYLSRVIQQVTGHTPAYWIMDFTVREAKTLLKSTTLTVTELSERMNFPNSSFFACYFRRHTGVSLQEYRKEGESK